MDYELNLLKQRFHEATSSLTLAQWRIIRNQDYFLSDYMPPKEALIHKLERVMYYKQNKTIKPYSPAKVKEMADEFESKNKKSIL
jgi:hypothetical protein